MQGRLLIEPTSPFVAIERDEIRVADTDGPHPLLFDLLGAPERVVLRLLDPSAVERALLGSLTAIAAGTGLFAVMMMMPFGPWAALRSSVLVAMNVLIALSAALGPIWAAGLLASARLPLSRLVGALVTSAATGSLILAAFAPIPHLLQRWDPEWAGPLAVVFCFAAAALTAGKRMHRTLLLMAEAIKRARTDAPLDPAERDRVSLLARVSMVVFSFTVALSVWGFDAFLWLG
jgi:hypothetical protein